MPDLEIDLEHSADDSPWFARESTCCTVSIWDVAFSAVLQCREIDRRQEVNDQRPRRWSIDIPVLPSKQKSGLLRPGGQVSRA